MGTGHLIMGELTDYLTGKILPDTHDERILQKISRFLVEKKSYLKTDIIPRRTLALSIDQKSGVVRVHFTIKINDISWMILMYGPGSVVTRERPTLAAARLIEKNHIVPFCAITNGMEASVMDTRTGKVFGKDLKAIFSKTEVLGRVDGFVMETLSPDRREKEERILFAMDVLTEAECTEFTCTLRP